LSLLLLKLLAFFIFNSFQDLLLLFYLLKTEILKVVVIVLVFIIIVIVLSAIVIVIVLAIIVIIIVLSVIVIIFIKDANIIIVIEIVAVVGLVVHDNVIANVIAAVGTATDIVIARDIVIVGNVIFERFIDHLRLLGVLDEITNL
jgi:hypothetical protein